MSKQLENRICIVTGAAKGLGESISKRFLTEGAVVIGLDIRPAGYSMEHYHSEILDVTDKKSCETMIERVISEYGRIDVLINNAGITSDSLTAKMTDDMWDHVIDVDLKGVFNLTRFVAPYMEAQKYGSIVNISSVVGEFGNIGQANYAAAKAGVIGLTKTWAKEFARKGAAIRVNCVAPGYTLTDMLKTVPQNLLDKFAARTMLGRLGQPEEIANAVLFLASDESSYVTGHVLSVNGGMRL